MFKREAPIPTKLEILKATASVVVDLVMEAARFRETPFRVDLLDLDLEFSPLVMRDPVLDLGLFLHRLDTDVGGVNILSLMFSCAKTVYLQADMTVEFEQSKGLIMNHLISDWRQLAEFTNRVIPIGNYRIYKAGAESSWTPHSS